MHFFRIIQSRILCNGSQTILPSAQAGAMMPRCHHALSATVLAVWLLGVPTLAQAQPNESPITPGFWSFPVHKAVTTEEIRAACRNHFEIRFADGHFIGLRMHKTEGSLVQREIEENRAAPRGKIMQQDQVAPAREQQAE